MPLPLRLPQQQRLLVSACARFFFACAQRFVCDGDSVCSWLISACDITSACSRFAFTYSQFCVLSDKV